MKNISKVSLFAFGAVFAIFSILATFNALDIRHIFSIRTAYADPIVSVTGFVKEGDTVSDANPGMSGVVIELYDATNTLLSTGTTDATGAYILDFDTALGAASACVVIPDGYERISDVDCQPIGPDVTADVELLPFTLSTNPALTLNGPSTISINQGFTFVDPGATATKSGRSIDVTSVYERPALDVQVPGSYLITYTAHDPVSNLETTAQRTVNVLSSDAAQQQKMSGYIRTDSGSASLLTTPGMLSVEIRDASNATVATAAVDATGLYTASVLPAPYNACLIVPGGYGVVGGEACVKAVFQYNQDITLPDISLSTLPIITLNGDKTMSIDFGMTFVDPGATASKDGSDISSTITVSGLPDVNTAGLYTVSYVVIDPATKLSATTTRTVEVKKKEQHGSSGGGVIGGYLPQPPRIDTPASVVVAEPVSVATATPVVTYEGVTHDVEVQHSRAPTKTTERQQAPKGSVLGATTKIDVHEQPIMKPIITTSAMQETAAAGASSGDYVKVFLSLIGFGLGAWGLWWAKKYIVKK